MRRALPLVIAAALIAIAPPVAVAKPVRLNVEVNGDLLIHSPVWQRAAALAGHGYDFAPLLRQVKPWIRGADLAFCHVETPMTSAPPLGYPVFNTPPALARAIRSTGWDACSTASNHTLDQGQSGIAGTLRALNHHGIRHSGSATSKQRSRHITMVRAKGVKVALLAYATMTNGIPLPHPWSVDLADPDRIIRDAAKARRLGARAVIVNLHWGTEYQSAPDAQQRAIVKRLGRSRDITAIVGQHVHVVQPIKRIHRRWVVFGEGNLLSNQTAACCPTATQDGMLVLLHLRVGDKRSRVKRVRYVPTYVRHPDYTVVPVRPSSASWHRTVSVVGRRPGLRPVG
jgi:poly-gamma-glutamate capsule biosynthesis protein CapA/YwtB (metallophosphatase superfamily)